MPEPGEVLVGLFDMFHNQARGIRQTIDLPWPALSRLSKALYEGKVCIVAGPQNTGKSFFITHIALKVHESGATWRYLPLEDNKDDFALRLLSIKADTYRLLDDDRHGAQERLQQLEQHHEWLKAILDSVDENPRAPVEDDRGVMKVKNFTWEDALEWLRLSMEKNRVTFMDPTTQIDFGARDSYQQENIFIREFLGLAAHCKGTIVFVSHTKDRSGAKSRIPITVEDIQGSTLWRKLCQTAILLDAHEERNSMVYGTNRYSGDKEQQSITHNRTVVIGRTRQGSGSRMRFAYSQSPSAPTFCEHGIIVPKALRD